MRHPITAPAILNNRFFVTVSSAVLVVACGVADYFSGWELGFFVFYFIPVSLAAWYAGRWAAVGISLLSGATWFAADFLLQQHYSSLFYPFWNTFIRVVAFLALSMTTSYARGLLNAERKISGDLRQALSEVRTLSGMLPICASCKKIRNDKGYWEQIEVYVRNHSDADFTHGLCEDCARRLYPGLFDKAPAVPRDRQPSPIP